VTLRANNVRGENGLASADILPRAHARHRTPVTLLCTIGGALFMLLIVGLAS
jgi:ZIP family zinc transporter